MSVTAAASSREYVRAQTVQALFRQASFGPLLSLVAAALVVAGVWRVVSHQRLIVWLTAIGFFSILRLVLLLRYRRAGATAYSIRAWEQAFVYTLLGLSLAWGVGAVYVMPDSVTHEVLIYFFLAGIAGSTVATYSAHPLACVLALTALILPPTLWFAWHEVIELRVMAVGGVLYLAAAVRAALNYGTFWRSTFRLSWDLDQARELADTLARTDVLTGLHNRRAFRELAEQELRHAQRYNRPLAVVVFDIDRFKTINDTRGHAAGDRVLEALGAELRRLARKPDIPGRTGGEEFAIVLPETSEPEAVVFAERSRAGFAALAVPYEGNVMRFTCSFGVAVRTDDVTVLDTLLDRADAAMYRAKEGGRNRVVS